MIMRNEVFVYLDIYSVYLEIYDYGVLVQGVRFPDAGTAPRPWTSLTVTLNIYCVCRGVPPACKNLNPSVAGRAGPSHDSNPASARSFESGSG
jgi:hypothetical protein